MKRFVLFSTTLFCFLFLLASGSVLKAQNAPVKLWDFEKDFDGWYFTPEGGTVLLSTEKATTGKRSVKFIGVNNSIEANFMNDTHKDFKEGDIVKFKVWLSAADLAYVNGLQIFWQTGAGWTWNSKWFGAASLKGDDWNTLDLVMPALTAPFQRIGVQLLLQAGNEAKVPVMYIDEISISRPIGEYYWTENWNDDTIEGRLTGTTSDAPTTLKDVNTATGVWQAIYAIRGGSNQCDGTGRTLRLLSTSNRPQGGAAVTPAVYGGIGVVKFVEGRGGTNRVIKVSKSRDNGATWMDVKTINGTTKCEQILVEVNDGRANKLKFQNMSTGDVDIDNITFNTYEDALPPFIVSKWGKASSGGPWPILNTASTPAGNASMGDGKTSTGWSTLRGQFPELQATTSKAVVVTGKLQLIGGGGENAYTHLRYALEFQDGTTLINPLTETAQWTSTAGFYGYGFHPRSGTGTMSNARGGAGTLWLIDGGGFNSGWGGNNTAAVGADESTALIEQAPRNAQMIEGTYNFAISVKMITATTAEVRWYLVEENNKYWFGGTKVVKAKTDKFNGISFGVNNDSKATMFSVMSVKADLGEQITVPEAPWQAFYVSKWGKSSAGGPWPIKNNAETLVGDASMGDGKPSTGWSTLSGGFEEALPLKTNKELIVKGQLQYVGGGGGDAYTHLRYALTFQDSVTLKDALTENAQWSSTKGFYGYSFHPRTGNGTMSNARGGAGTLWLVNGGGFHSGWGGNNTAQVGSKGNTVGIEQAPRNAQMVAGTYNFAISVKSINDTTNQIKWYLVEEGNKYWFGGTELVKSITKKFNAINFGVNNDNTITQFNVLEVMVDYGTITVPEAPWQAYYVDKWGKSSAGGPWPIKNNAETLVGDASMGDGKTSTGWSTLSGGFGQALPLKKDKELIVKGQMQLVGGGGGDAYTHLRYGITFQDSVTLKDALTENAQWSSTKGFYGYSFHPRSGNATMSNARGGAGTVWLVDGGGFHSGWGGNNTAQVGVNGNTLGIDQIPRNAEMIAGTYNFAISIKMVNDTSSIVKWYLIEENNKYYFGGTETLKSKTNKYNAISFGVNNDSKATMFNVLEVMVDYGTLVVPDAPFEPFYVGDWGFIGNRSGGWTLTPGELTGDVAISGTAAPTGWSAIRGGFVSPVKPTVEKPMVVTGKMELQGGGFEAWSSLRLGLFTSDSAGTVTNNAWSGLERAHSGYLFIPHSGSNDLTNWTGPAQLGTVGAVVNGTWISTAGASNYVLTNKKQKGGAVGSAGKYNFAFSIGPKSDGSNEVRYYIYKEDKSYSFGGIVIDNRNPIVTKVFNSFNIGLNTNANTRALKITDLYVNLDKHITIPEDVLSVKAQDGEIPTQYNLSQNYPNPFNPSTTIDFALPKNGHVSLVVYDVLGREVANLVQGEFSAGNYKVNFDASNLSSGIYFYKLQSEEFVSIKKLMLLK
ncbi:MAG: T9SS type A sorting domain-containing protein [Melioribacteraceae bacterium]|nr:T9SS type A sorting domain-containing protein [Melioribacteraceae bacterium]